ncbi:MAG: hypothetical protein ACLTMP_05345 [Eggerthella lenta]
MAFRMVIDYEGGSWQPDVDGTFSQDAFAYHVSISCNHQQPRVHPRMPHRRHA